MDLAGVILAPFHAIRNRWKVARWSVDADPMRLAERRGVIHIGAHLAGERYRYAYHGLNVLWVEGDPAIFKRLEPRLAGLPRQKAANALISETDDVEIAFHVSSNDGQSSSILEMSGHRRMFPDVGTSRTLRLTTETFPALARRLGLSMHDYDVLVLDVQGAELMVLRGMGNLLSGFDALQIEAADFEAYAGAPLASEIEAFCSSAGFRITDRQQFADRPGIGSYYDLTFEKVG